MSTNVVSTTALLDPRVIFSISLKGSHPWKIYILDQNSAGGRFLRFVASLVSYAIFKFEDNYKCYLLKKFEHFITSSLSVALIWTFLPRSYSNAWGSTNFSYIQFNGGIKFQECSNEHCRQTTGDKMLKFLEEVKLGVIFTLLHFKKTEEKDFAKNLEKHPRVQFWPKMLSFKKTQCPISMKLSKISILSSFTCI